MCEARTHARTHTHTHACQHARTHARIHAYTHARTNARTNARTHAPWCLWTPFFRTTLYCTLCAAIAAVGARERGFNTKKMGQRESSQDDDPRIAAVQALELSGARMSTPCAWACRACSLLRHDRRRNLCARSWMAQTVVRKICFQKN